MRLLVVEDNAELSQQLRNALSESGFAVDVAADGEEGLHLGSTEPYDAVVLDLGLPDMDGKDVITSIREWSQVPIIVLSVCSLDQEIADALNRGANDYVTKPFNVEVLLARINASLRAAAVRDTGESELCNGTLRMDLVRHEVFVDGKLTPFTPKEYDLLRHFMIHRGKMLTHKDILKSVWGASHAEDTTYLRVYIGQIREKIEAQASQPVFIKTEPGIGYRMETFPSGISQAA